MHFLPQTATWRPHFQNERSCCITLDLACRLLHEVHRACYIKLGGATAISWPLDSALLPTQHVDDWSSCIKLGTASFVLHHNFTLLSPGVLPVATNCSWLCIFSSKTFLKPYISFRNVGLCNIKKVMKIFAAQELIHKNCGLVDIYIMPAGTLHFIHFFPKVTKIQVQYSRHLGWVIACAVYAYHMC